MQTILPAKGYLFCKPEESIKQTASGILLSDKAAEKPKIAGVVNVGEGVAKFNAHDQVIYKSYAATEFKLNGEDYFLIHCDDVLGTVLEVEDEHMAN